MSTRSPEVSADLMDALWEAVEAYAVPLSPLDQLAVARVLASLPVGTITATKVVDAFAVCGLARPPRGFGSAVVARARALGGSRTFLDVLIDFRRAAINDLSRIYGGGRAAGHEDELRRTLKLYLPEHAHAEAETGRGNTDLIIPVLNALIETKIWGGPTEYHDGLDEMATYIRTGGYSAAYMVMFCDRIPPPSITDNIDEPIVARPVLSGIEVPVLLVPFEVDYPSKVGYESRKRARK